MKEDTPTDITTHPDYRQLEHIANFLEDWSEKALGDESTNSPNELFSRLGIDHLVSTGFAVERGYDLYQQGGQTPPVQLLAVAWADGFIMGLIYASQVYPE